MKTNSSISSSHLENEHGSFLIYFSILLIVLLTAGSFAVDLGFGYSEMRRMHIATDNAALAAMYELVARADEPNDGAKRNAVLQVANVIAQSNGVTAGELNAGQATGIELGSWDVTTSTFTPQNNIANVDAVRVGARRTVPTILAVLFGQENLHPIVSSIAYGGYPTVDTCLTPYGITQDLIQNAQFGDTLTVDRGSASPGNWGKINIDPEGNMSAYPEFLPAFLSGVCSAPVSIGQRIPSATGFAAVQDAFEQRMQANPVIKVAVVADFYNGKKPVEIVGFATVEIVSTRGNGRNWTADLRFLSNTAGSGLTGPGGGVLNRSVALVR